MAFTIWGPRRLGSFRFFRGPRLPSPDWPAGLPAPVQDPPKVIAPVKAWLDRTPLEVTRATLAPGYAGLYLIDLQLPAVLNRGTSELYIEAGDAASNRVQLWTEP